MKDQYMLYGINRVSKDFIYIFDEIIDIVGIVDNYGEKEDFAGKKVYKESILNERQYKIIICDFDKRKRERSLINFGYRYKEDYFYEEDFFRLLDSWNIPENRDIAVWGMGKIGSSFIERHPDLKIKYYIDCKEQENAYLPEQINNWKSIFVIITTAKWMEIADYLEKKGLAEGVDFVPYYQLENMPSELLKKTIFDQSCYDLQCETMLNHLEVLNQGNTSCCCTTFMDNRLGEVLHSDNIWESITHKILCLSSQNRTYSFCKKDMCPFFIGRNKIGSIDLDTPYKKMLDHPKVVAVAFDKSCNLHCQTCRKNVLIAQGKDADNNSRLMQYIQDHLLDKCELLIAAGDGEVFLSKYYKGIYLDPKCNDIPNIRLLTNGTLFNSTRWGEFIKNKTGKIYLTVSIDAATEETYKKIRCGGNFKILRENMKFASKLRKTGELGYFRINFVVQKNNYKEMIDFVKWGIELGCDEVFFTKILNWGTYTKEEFKEISMMKEDGITPKEELQKVLDNPIMKNPIVDIGTIQYSHKPVKEKYIENYYIWELNRKTKQENF